MERGVLLKLLQPDEHGTCLVDSTEGSINGIQSRLLKAGLEDEGAFC